MIKYLTQTGPHNTHITQEKLLVAKTLLPAEIKLIIVDPPYELNKESWDARPWSEKEFISFLDTVY